MSVFDFFKSGWQQTVHLENAALFPLSPDSKPHDVKGGVRHPDLPQDFNQHSYENRGTNQTYLDTQPAPPQRLEGRGLYGGPFFRHYGHFIADSIHRLWAWMQAPGSYDYIAVMPQIPHPRFRPSSARDLSGFQRDILTYMGIPLERLQLILEPVIAQDLTVPKQASVLEPQVRTPKSYIDFWREHETRFFAGDGKTQAPMPERLYVSRANYLARGSFAGEYYLETAFADAGFHIVRPETLPVVEQLRLYRNAKLIVFSEGSALHTLELLGPLKGDIVCLLRRPKTQSLWQNFLMDRCCHAGLFDKVTLLPSMAVTPAGVEKHNVGLTVLDVAALVDYLRAAGLASLDSFDLNRFQEAEAADVGRYLVNVMIKQTLANHQLEDRFTAFRNALADHDNPYLKESL